MYHIACITAPTKTIGTRIAKTLVSEKLAACATVIGPSESHYRWKGKLEQTKEYIVIAKTMKRIFPALRKRTLQMHPYECPCIVSLKIDDGNTKYLQWIQECIFG